MNSVASKSLVFRVFVSCNVNAMNKEREFLQARVPDPAFADPRLVTACPHCGEEMKFNPFFVHNFG